MCIRDRANLFSKPYNAPSSSDAFCTIIGSQGMEADFTVLESELPLIKGGDKVSHVTEEKLSLLTGLDERTIRRVIKRLKDEGYLTVKTTIKEDADRGFIKRNSYYIKPAKKNYLFLDNSFFKRNYPAKIAGFLLLLKAICINNKDTIQ